MWKRFAGVLRCPLCRGKLSLDSFEESRPHAAREYSKLATKRGFDLDEFETYIEFGQLYCDECSLRFPVMHGLPVMLPYRTPLHAEFEQRFPASPGKATEFKFPDVSPMPGEDFVRNWFSTEWLEYDYDGVIWELDYQDHEIRFRKEVGDAIDGCNWFLEVGCGLGLATSIAQQESSRDCVGLDLSLAGLKATNHFRDNPFLHFVQASAFYPPFDCGQFGVLYSRGVLHHTFSTERAFNGVSPLCSPGGTMFVWLYGPRSIWSTPLRVVLFALESVARPIVSSNPTSLISTAFLEIMATAYMAFNRLRRLTNPKVQVLNFRRAVHAARDRFTPKFAHRHSAEEIRLWFEKAGYESITVLDWREMPAADQDDFRRNVGIRAHRKVNAMEPTRLPESA